MSPVWQDVWSASVGTTGGRKEPCDERCWRSSWERKLVGQADVINKVVVVGGGWKTRVWGHQAYNHTGHPIRHFQSAGMNGDT